MASLGPKALWDKTKRWSEFGEELITTEIGSSMFCLSPTHEEAICSMVGRYAKMLSHMHGDIRLYQTSTKFRGELRPHGGLLRCREFLMNDLYTFDVDARHAEQTYNEVGHTYDSIFSNLEIDVLKAVAGTGLIGGSRSHEYHVRCDLGEDKISIDEYTGQIYNSEHEQVKKTSQKFKEVRAIEVGHMFYLGDKYSKLMNSLVIDQLGRAVPYQMGCYGLGVTRILGACLETLSVDNGMRWPSLIAPYKVCIVPPKAGSIEEKACGQDAVYSLYDSLQKAICLQDDVIIDDRVNRTIGWRLKHANMIGYPAVLVIGKGLRSSKPTAEIILQGKTNSTNFLPIEHVYDYLNHYFSGK